MNVKAPGISEQERRLFEKLKEDRAGAAEYFSKTFLRGLWSTITEKYSEQAHFIYELLQNADDAKATKARFLLSEDGLIFAHNGEVHFSISDPDSKKEEEDRKKGRLGHINAITSIGSSPKSGNEIGKFGIGFKSVFQYTETPHIYDPPFMFKVERLIVPHLLDRDHPERRKEETLFWLPFNSKKKTAQDAFQETGDRLQKLENPLLFLRHLREIEWKISTGEEGIYLKDSEENDVYTEIRLLHLVNKKEVEHSFIVFQKELENFEKNKKKLYIHIAFKTDKDGKISHEDTFPCYCYFPTKEYTNLRFIIQAPFILTDSRDLLIENDPINKTLIKKLALFLQGILHKLKEKGKLDTSLLKALPIYDDIPPQFKPLYDAVLDKFKSGAKLLPAEGGGHVSSKSAFLARGRELSKLLTPQQLSLLFGKPDSNWVSTEITENTVVWNYLKDHLNIPVIRPEDVVGEINKSFFEQQSDEWMAHFYRFVSKRRKLWKELKRKPLIRLDDNSHVVPFNEKGELEVFLPTEEGSPYPTVKRNLLTDKEIDDFLREFGIKRFREIDEIVKFILPKYNEPESISESENLKHVKKVFNVLKKSDVYYIDKFLEEVKNTPLLAADNFATGQTVYKKPSEIYLPKEFTDSTDLEIYFEGNPDIYFLNLRYRGMDVRFFKRLGCQENIKVKYREPNPWGHVPIRDFHSNHERGLDGFDPDCTIDGLDYALENINIEKARIIWDLLKKYWQSIKGIVEFCRRQDYTDSEKEEKVSWMGRLVREHRWLPDKEGKFHHPSEIKLEDLHESIEKESIEAQMVARNIGMKSDIDEEIVNKLPPEKRRYLELIEKYPPSILDDSEIFKQMEQILEAKAKRHKRENFVEVNNELNYEEELEKTFSRPQLREPKNDHVPPGEVPNPQRRFDKVREEINIDKANEPPVPERFKRVPTKKWEQKNFEARTFLKEQYGGKCQICNYSFNKRNGEPYFEGVYLVSRTKAKWIDRPGNILCLCANCCAKFTHGTVEAPDILAQIKDIQIDHLEENELFLKIMLCGKEESIRFTPRHMIDLQAIIQSENDKRKDKVDPILVKF